MAASPGQENLKAPHYGLPVVMDFFFSGTSAGAAVTAAIALVAGGPGTRAIAEAGHLIAFPLICISLGLLIADLGRPMRFLHMLWSRKASTAIGEWAITPFGFHLKPLSPMSVGAWGLSVYSAVTFLSLVFTWIRPGWAPQRIELLAALTGAFLGFFVGGYKGVLLRATAQPVWRSARWLGPLLLASGAASGVAAIALVTLVRGGSVGDHWTGIAKALTVTVALQVVVLGVFLVDLGAEAQLLWQGRLAVPFWGIGVAAGLVVPLVPVVTTPPSPIGPFAVLAGSLALRYVVLIAPSMALGEK